MRLATVLAGPDAVALWIRLDLLIRLVGGRRVEGGAPPETDEQLDKLMWLRARVAWRLVNWRSMTLGVLTISPERFAMRLKEIRESRGLTQEARAKRAGISRAYLARLDGPP